MNIVATTYSALAAGLLRHQAAGQSVLRATAPQPVAPQEHLERAFPESTPLSATYDARGKLDQGSSSDDLVGAAVELLRAEDQVEVSASVLQRAHEIQGSLLDVLA